MQTIEQKINQYRTVRTSFLQFPFKVKHLDVIGVTKNDGVSKMKGLSMFSFDSISYLSTSEKGFIHAVAVSGKQLYQVILKQTK